MTRTEHAAASPHLKRIEGIHQAFGIPKGVEVLVKDESENWPSGTHKARRNRAILGRDSCIDGVVYVDITSGNSGYDMALQSAEFERQTGKKRLVVNVVDEKLSPLIVGELEKYSIVVKMDLRQRFVSDDELKQIAKEEAKKRGFGNLGEHNIKTIIDKSIHPYAPIMDEILREVYPTFVFAPLGGGELLYDIVGATPPHDSPLWRNSQSGRAIGETGHTPIRPHLYGITLRGNVFSRFSLFNRKVGDTMFIQNLETSVADKLFTPCSQYLNPLLQELRGGNWRLYTVSRESSIINAYRKCQKLGIRAEPSAAAAFIPLNIFQFEPGDVVVVVNTGEGIYDRRKMKRACSQDAPHAKE